MKVGNRCQSCISNRPSVLSHAEIWSAIDALATRFDASTSGLAKMGGLDPTSFNRSKRLSSDVPPRLRWPSTESLAKVLTATGVSFGEFATMTEDGAGKRRRGVPLLGFARAGDLGYFDDAGFPVGQGWDEIDIRGDSEGVYALEIAGDSMLPVYRAGDRILVQPTGEPRRGDRVVVKTTEGEVMAKEVVRISVSRMVLLSLNPACPIRALDRRHVAWMARIMWVTQ